MLGNRQLEFSDYVAIARRHRWLILIPVLILPIAAYLGSLLIANRYTSQTLILVEQQKVPDAFVKPVVTEELNERLTTMQEQILSRTRLQPIIEKFSLAKKGQSTEDAIDQVRKEISVSAIKSDFGDRTGGLPGFYISFTGDDPKLAQQVCSQITSMFVTENLRVREQHAQGTTDFLSSQVEDAKRKLDEQDAKLAEFKTKNINLLPGDEQTNLSILNSLNTRLDAISQQIAQANQQKSLLDGMLARQVADWKNSQGDAPGSLDELQKKKTSLQNDLITLQAKYTPDHPDVIKLKRLLADVDKRIDQANERQASGKSGDSNKPAGIEPADVGQMRINQKNLEDTIRFKTAEQERVQKEIRSYQARIQSTPAVEGQYKALSRDYESAQKFYEDLLNKKRQSEVATDLERRQQGEQFRVMDPPNLPERPTYPNRIAITLGGLLGGLVLGGGLSFLLELRDKSLRDEREVMAMLKLPTLAAIPNVQE